LRGEKSILKNNNALFVVDGVITNNYDRTLSNELSQVDFGNSANDIDPDEIESITVLEGPAAAALYGERGAMGAVMITTKKGKRHEGTSKNSKLDVTIKTTFTQFDILKFADLQHQYGQGNIYQGIADDRRENFSWGLPFDNALRPWGQIIDGKQLIKPYSDQPNNVKSFFNHGQDLNNYVGISGGSENSTYFLSLNSLNSNGAIPNTFYNKYSVRFNASTQLSNNFYSSINVNYVNTYSRAANGGQASGSVMDNLNETARDIPIWELKDLNNKYYSQQYIDTAGVERYGNYGAYYKNPYWVAKNYDNRNRSDRVLGDINFGFKKGSFNVVNRLGVDVASDRSTYKTPNLNATAVDPFYASLNFLSPGGLSQFNTNFLNLNNDLMVTYIHSLSRNFGINALVGHNASITQSESLDASIDPGSNGLVIPNYYYFSNNVGPVTVGNPINKRRSHGVYADVKFNFQRELFLELTGRNEWSSTLPFDHNSYFYPGANVSWAFTERLNGTKFKKNVLNYGKLRFAASGVGSSGIAYANNPAGYNQYAIASGFGTIQPPFNGIPGFSIASSFGSPNLKPERTREVEFGTELSFLNDRLNGTFTYYSNTTVDLITLAPIPSSTGYESHYINVGDITNKGVEVSMRGTPIKTKWGLTWDLFATYTHNKNNVERLSAGLDNVTLGGYNGLAIVAAAGHPLGTFYGADIQYWNGHAVVDPTTGLPVATTKPVYRGSYQPRFIASWGTDLSWKGLKLHMLFTCKQGGQFFSRTKMNMDFNGTSQETTVNGRNPYVWNNSVYNVAGTDQYIKNTTQFSPYNYYTNIEGTNLPAQGLVDAGYVRLQEASLSYKIPTKYYKRSPFGQLEAGIFGTNLLLWTSKSNKYDDPEQTSAGAGGNGQGFNYTAYPSVRNYGISVKATF
jgi:TonB-linked SusC/RagA family outer membrane protein